MFDPEKFVEILLSIKGDLLFNPYTQVCSVHDKVSAPDTRLSNLMEYLQLVEDTDTLLIGEAPGYLGCRRTGIPFVDDRHLPAVAGFLGLQLTRATVSGREKEQSSLHMWRTLTKLTRDKIPFIWNIIPYHPFKKGKDLSNRRPSKKDFDLTKEVIQYLLVNGNFTTILAVGRVAEAYIKKLGYNCTYVRHPSYGGSHLFSQQVFSLLS